MKTQRWGKQLFLNEATVSDSGVLKANIKLVVENDGSTPYLSSEFEAWDCSDKVVLDFSPLPRGKSKNVAARRRKVRRLRQFVNTYADAYETYLDLLERALVEHKAKQKKGTKK